MDRIEDQMLNRCLTYLAWAFLAMLATTQVALAEPSQDQRCNRAMHFLEMLDNAQYETAWNNTTPLFKLLNDQHEWQRRQQAIREGYGTPPMRSLSFIKQKQAYAQSPDGNYVFVQFDSVFPHKAKAVETVILDCQTPLECTVREYTIN